MDGTIQRERRERRHARHGVRRIDVGDGSAGGRVGAGKRSFSGRGGSPGAKSSLGRGGGRHAKETRPIPTAQTRTRAIEPCQARRQAGTERIRITVRRPGRWTRKETGRVERMNEWTKVETVPVRLGSVPAVQRPKKKNEKTTRTKKKNKSESKGRKRDAIQRASLFVGSP